MQNKRPYYACILILSSSIFEYFVLYMPYCMRHCVWANQGGRAVEIITYIWNSLDVRKARASYADILVAV